MKVLVVCLSGSSQKSRSLSGDSLKVLLASWRRRNKKRFNFRIKIFPKLCRERYTDAIETITEMRIEFLAGCFKTGVGYSLANSVRSVIFLSILKPVCKINFGMQTLKGIFNIRPALSRYVKTWGFTKVFTFIKSNQLLQTVTCENLSENSNPFVL